MRPGLLLGAALVAATPCARAASPFAHGCRSAEAIVCARVSGPADEMGLTPVVAERWIKRGPGVEANESLLARLPARAARPGRWLLLLVPDGVDPNLRAWAPVDPETGWIPLDGTAGAPADLLNCAAWALDPPEPAELRPRLVEVLGRGDTPAAFALGELMDRPEMLREDGPRVGDAVRRMLASRLVTPQTAALGVRALGEIARGGDDARLIDLVASGAPEVVVDAVVEVLPRLSREGTGEMIEHALGGATDAAIPGLLRLVGAARARSLAWYLLESLQSSRRPVRLAALGALRDLGDASSLPAVRALASHPDAETARAAQRALATWPAAP